MKLATTLIFIYCIVTTSLIAQDKDTLFFDNENIWLDEMIVSANRWEEDPMEVPGKISTINLTRIQRNNPRSAADILSLTPGVFIQKSQGGGGSPMLRGFAANRVLLVVDGVRMNNAIFRSGNVQNVISLDPNLISEAEVIFGPGSVMYGSDAIGGVMDFHTIRPEVSKNGKATSKINTVLRYSSTVNEKTIHGDISIGLKKWAFLTGVTKSDFGDIRMGTKGPDDYTLTDYVVQTSEGDKIVKNENWNIQRNTSYDQANLMQKIRFKLSDEVDFGYAFHYSTTSAFGRYDRLILRANGSPVHAEWYYGPQKWLMNSFYVHSTRKGRLADQVKLVAAYQKFKESRHTRALQFEKRMNRFEEINALSFNLDLNKNFGTATTLFYGTELIHNKVYSEANQLDITNGNKIPASTRYPDGSTWNSYALYMNLKHRLAKKLIINGSARYSYFDLDADFDPAYFNFPFSKISLGNGALNGSTGLIYNFHKADRFYFNLSTAFRSPNIDDAGKVFDSRPGNVTVPNPDLEPEYAYNAEAGISLAVFENLKIDFASYYTILDNAIIRSRYLFNGDSEIIYDGTLSQVEALRNNARVYTYGIQAGIDWNVNSRWRMYSGLNYQRGKEKNMETRMVSPPTHLAPLFGTAHIIYRGKKIKGDFYVEFNGEKPFSQMPPTELADAHLYTKDSNGDPFTPTWQTLNLKLSYFPSSKFIFDAGVENMLDKRYRPFASGIAAPGRNFILAFRYHY